MITVYFNQNPYTKKSYFVDKHEIQETNEGYKIKTYYRRGHKIFTESILVDRKTRNSLMNKWVKNINYSYMELEF